MLRVVERIGRAFRFSPKGRKVRVWVSGLPGEEGSEVVGGTIVELRGDDAVVRLDDGREALVVPRERGWGLPALWFSFIAVDAFELPDREPRGRWFVRLGSPR
jgi:hypothetical protein